MVVKRIVYSRAFQNELKKIPAKLVKLAALKEKIFRDNPLHPSLRLHQLHGKLKGLWSLSITANCRIIFERQVNGEIFFISIGNHDIYKNL